MKIECPNCKQEIEITDIIYVPETRWQPEEFDFEYVHETTDCSGIRPDQEDQFNLKVYHLFFKQDYIYDTPFDDDLPF